MEKSEKKKTKFMFGYKKILKKKGKKTRKIIYYFSYLVYYKKIQNK